MAVRHFSNLYSTVKKGNSEGTDTMQAYCLEAGVAAGAWWQCDFKQQEMYPGGS
jgi:hypothetical protein